MSDWQTFTESPSFDAAYHRWLLNEGADDARREFERSMASSVAFDDWLEAQRERAAELMQGRT